MRLEKRFKKKNGTGCNKPDALKPSSQHGEGAILSQMIRKINRFV